MIARPPSFYLERLHRIAGQRGGALLSAKYAGDRGKLRFRCAEGHVWRTSPSDINQGSWCPRCGRTRSAGARTGPAAIRLRRIVSERGGILLSPVYVNNRTRLRYRCGEGHEWEAAPQNISAGRWCPQCAKASRARHHAGRKLVVIHRLARIVEARGGEVVAPGFVDCRHPMRVRCARGHTWASPVQGIQDGAWCPRCREEDLLAVLRAQAERLGGTCLSKCCRSGKVLLRYQCAVGHRFQRRGHELKRGIWCPKCRGVGTGDLARMRRLARERGGECLSSEYDGCEPKLRWRCHQRHEWRMSPADTVRGHWCPECARWSSHSRARLSIADMHHTASERGGACLSRTYHGNRVRLRWRCARGHRWWAHPNRVRQGSWCAVCSMLARGTVEGMRALAVERGGRCLTRTWDDHRRPLHFECAHGHRFHALGPVVKSGVWCPTCPR